MAAESSAIRAEALREFSAVKPETARPRILEAAVRCGAERGLDAMTVREIACAAGVTDAAIFRYWPSKEALIDEALRLCIQSIQREFQAEDEPEAGSERRLRRFVRVAMRRAHQKPASWRFVRHAVDEHLSGRAPRLTLNHDPLQAIVRDGMERGELRPQPLALATEMIIGAVQRGIRALETADEPIPDEQGIDLIARGVWSMVRA